MKITVVPAQVTTVEDRIIGSLGFSQMMLLIVPVFIGAGLFALLPPAMGVSEYKFVIMGMLALVCSILAIRIKGKILALWLIQLLRYNLRPTYYVFDKNSSAQREEYQSSANATDETAESITPPPRQPRPTLAVPDAVSVYTMIEDPVRSLRFETNKKGALYVRLNEIED